MTEESISFVFEGSQPERIDRVVLDALANEPELIGITRSQIKKAIEQGLASVDGSLVTKAGALVKPGHQISFVYLAPEPIRLTAWSYELDIVYEDSDLLVVNKPAGLVVHPGAGNPDQTLANAILGHCGQRSEQVPRVGIVHRLDKDTTGLLVVAKTAPAHSFLSQQLQDRLVKRTYSCLVFVTPRAKRLVQREQSGTITTLVGRHVKKRTLMQVLENSGRQAITHWNRVRELGYACELELGLETGRTHQIRVHMDHIGSPVLGDRSYGDFSGLPKPLLKQVENFGRQALHATKLEFVHPSTGAMVSFSVDVPKDHQELIQSFVEYDY